MTQSQRRDVLKAAGTVAVIGGLAGCAEGEEPVEDQEGETAPEETQEEPDDDVGAFRVAHASPDAPNVDIYFDDQAVIEDLGFREVSPYEEIEPGSYQVQVTAADDPDTVVFDEEVEVEGGVTNTAVAFGEAAGGPENEFTVEVLEDDISDPGEDTSRVRLFHASPDAEDVDIVVAEAPEETEEDEEDEPPEDEEEEAPEEEPPDEEPGEDEPEQTQQDEEPPEDEPAEEDEEPEDEEMPDDEPEDDEDEEPEEEPQVGEPLFEGVGFGDSDTQEVPAGDYTLEVVPAEEEPDDEEEPAPDEEEEAPEDEPDEEEAPEDEPDDEEEPEPQQQEEDDELPEDEEEEEEEEPDEEPVDEFELSTESQTVYSAFAVGYVGEPEDEEPEDEEPEEDENGLLQNEEGEGDEGDEEDEEFEVIIVEDAQEGERADGGTDGNGLLTLTH